MSILIDLDRVTGGQQAAVAEKITGQELLDARQSKLGRLLEKASSRVVRLPEEATLEVASLYDIESVYKLFLAACSKGSEKGGFLRNTYSREELAEFIKEGNVRTVRDQNRELAAFAVVVPGDHPKFQIERLSIGFPVGPFFVKTCTWLDGKFAPLDWSNLRYVALFAHSTKHVICPDQFKSLTQALKQEEPDKPIYMSTSGEPKPNLFMSALATDLGFEKVAYFRSRLGRPMAYVDGTRWIRPWRSDIYRLS